MRWTSMLMRLAAFIVLAAGACARGGPSERGALDLVLRGGRVMDPASGLDAVRDVGIRGGRIIAVSAPPLEGREVLDVRGLVVAPGFIDLHAHGQDPDSSRWQVHDGVTTALALEGGAGAPPPRRLTEWYAAREGKARLNFGTAASHMETRRDIMTAAHDPERRDFAYRAATAEELVEIESHLREALADGALGIGLTLGYTPGATREEAWRVFGLAAAHNVPVFVHVRSSGMIEPGSSIEAAHEVIADAAATGAGLHIVRIASSGLRQTRILLDMIDGGLACAVLT